MSEESPYFPCPFCREGDFDVIGLRGHLVNNYCEVYNTTPTPMEQAMERRKKEKDEQH